MWVQRLLTVHPVWDIDFVFLPKLSGGGSEQRQSLMKRVFCFLVLIAYAPRRRGCCLKTATHCLPYHLPRAHVEAPSVDTFVSDHSLMNDNMMILLFTSSHLHNGRWYLFTNMYPVMCGRVEAQHSSCCYAINVYSAVRWTAQCKLPLFSPLLTIGLYKYFTDAGDNCHWLPPYDIMMFTDMMWWLVVTLPTLSKYVCLLCYAIPLLKLSHWATMNERQRY